MSEKSVAEKLLLKEGQRFLLLNAPAGYLDRMGEFPPNLRLVSQDGPPLVDVIQLFATSMAGLKGGLPELVGLMGPKSKLWVTYPKGSSGVESDLNRDRIRAYALSLRLQSVAMIAVDETWSALRLKLTEEKRPD